MSFVYLLLHSGNRFSFFFVTAVKEWVERCLAYRLDATAPN